MHHDTKALLDCMAACDACVAACLDQPDRASCVRLCLDCADLCMVSARLMARGSQFHQELCALCADIAEACAAAAGVAKVLLADDGAYAHPLAENLAPLVAAHAPEYSHLLAAATTFGKNVMPRAAALLDVGQISEEIGRAHV